jgi:hypothetical protein
MRNTWWNRLRRATRPRAERPVPASRPTVRLGFESLEPREVPTVSPYFLDTHGGLWGATDATSKLSRFTGVSGLQLSVGEVGGGQFAVVRDAHNHIAIFNGNNDVVTTTTVVARDVLAGRNEVFYRDAHNLIGVLTLGALNPDGTFTTTVVPTAGTAVQMKLGYDTTTAHDFVAYRAPDQSVRVLELVAGAPVLGNTGARAIDLDAGNQKEMFIRKANNQVDVLTINAATATGITFLPAIASGKAALSLSIGRGSPVGDDFMAYRAPDGSAHYLRFTPGATTVDTVDLPVAFARQVVAGVNEIFIRDRANRVLVFQQDAGGTTVTPVTVPPMTAARIVVTRFSAVAFPIDQIALVTAGGQLLVSQNNAGGTAIASFYNTGFFVRSVLGVPEFP